MNKRTSAAAATLLCVVGWAAAFASPLVNGSFEQDCAAGSRPKSWEPMSAAAAISSDSARSAGGRCSLRVDQKSAGTFAGATQALSAEPWRGRTVQLSGKVSSTAATDKAQPVIGLMLRTERSDGRVLTVGSPSSQFPRDGGWHRQRIILPIEAGADVIRVGGGIMGEGTAWIDELVLQELDANEEPTISAEARKYLERGIAVIRNSALHSASVDWTVETRNALYRAWDAKRADETYGALRYVLRTLQDRHSMLTPPGGSEQARRSSGQALVTASQMGDSVHVVVPAFAGGDEMKGDFIARLHEAFARHEAGARCGWIIDLRGNHGGDMWPMLAGLSPVLGDGIVGRTVFKSDVATWTIRGGAALSNGSERASLAEARPVHQSSAPVAVLIGPGTMSSGEAVAIAFSARGSTRSFGAPTAGLTTSNATFDLEDGARLSVAVGRFADRDGRTYATGVKPDVPIESRTSAQDEVADAARRWLEAQCPAAAREGGP